MTDPPPKGGDQGAIAAPHIELAFVADRSINILHINIDGIGIDIDCVLKL